MTIREFVSSVINTFSNQYSPDNKISGEYVYWIGINFSKLLLKREADSRRMFRNTALFSKLSCVEMEEVSTISCNLPVSCGETIMRSKKKLPESFMSNYGSIIQIFNPTRQTDYKEVSVSTYKNVSKQKYHSKTSKYFWIEDGYLYIPNSEVEVVQILGLFANPEEVKDFNESSSSSCKSILDSNFPVPDYLLSTVMEYTIKQVSLSRSVVIDEDTNLNSNDRQ